MKHVLFVCCVAFLYLIASVNHARADLGLTNTDNSSVDTTASKVIILIHGWNPDNAQDAYNDNGPWSSLKSNLNQALLSSDWKPLLYHWESSASTGSVNNYLISDFFNWGTATSAAGNAWAEGGKIADRLTQYNNLRMVHFIAHSAGSWAARQAAQLLLIRNPYVIVQITLLDPYIPDSFATNLGISSLSLTTGVLNNTNMGGIISFNGLNRIQRLENYYSIDEWGNGFNSQKSNGPTYGTQDSFTWRAGIDINQEIDWGGLLVNNPIPIGWIGPIPVFPPVTCTAHYDWHAGPIQFYADTVAASLGTVPSDLPTGNPYNYSQFGWYKSLCIWETNLPRITSQPSDQSTLVGNSATFTVAATSGSSYVWYKDNGTWVASGSNAYTVPNVSSGDDGTSYVVRVSNSAGMTFSRAAKLSVSAATFAITSVSPSVLTALPLPQTQTIHVNGFGFTSNSTLFFNGTTASDPTRLHFINSNELDYDLKADVAAYWTVRVVTGSQQSNIGTFTVVSPPTSTTGSLTVALQPAGAVAAGAQWQLDGGPYQNSGAVLTGLTPGTHSIACKGIGSFSAPTSHSVTITAGSVASDTETYIAIPSTTYTLSLNAASGQGSISPLPIGTGGGTTFTYNSGSIVQLSATAASGYHFTSWSGDAAGTVNPTTITLNGNKNVTANFATGDPNLGTICVTIQPSAAVTAGAQWKFNSSGWLNSGASTNTPLFGANENYLQFLTVPGWITPGSFYVNASGGQTTNVTVTYQQDMTPGLLTVTLSPPDALAAGAHWHVNGSTYGNGASPSLTPGSYVVTFDGVSGWTAPVSQSITILPSQTQTLVGIYTPPPGQPVIGSINPPIGPMSGGTLMTINGANFTTAASVRVGGQQASNVSVSSPTQITCITPPCSTYGSANVVVQTSGGSATNINGFSYGKVLGSKLDYISAVGGSCLGVAIQGNYAYIGEGRNVLALDISNPANPSRIGKVTLPGIVSGIALLNQYAYVADLEGGLQVVDVSTPSAPKLVGYYATTDQLWSAAISIYGGRAYVADETAGLQIFDLSNPVAPALLSSTNLGGGEAVVVKASSSGVFAYFSTGDRLCIVDVSNPQSPALRGQTPVNSGSVYSLAMSGNYVYAAALFGNLEIIDITNSNAPVDVGHAPTIYEPSAVTYAGGYLYASSLASNVLTIFSPSGASLSLLGKTTAIPSNSGYNLIVSGTKAYIAGASSGLEVVDISSPYSPSLLTTFTDSGAIGAFNSAAVTGNAMPVCGYPQGTNVGFNSIFDVSDPSAPTFRANPNVGGSSVLAKNGIAYVLEGNTCRIYNVASPSSPQLLKTFDNSVYHAVCMTLSGNTLFFGGFDSSYLPCLAAVDVTTPSQPAIRSTKSIPGYGSAGIYSIAINGNKAFIGMNTGNSVAVLDITNITAPVVLGSYSNLPYYPRGVQMSPDGSYGYVLSGNPSTLYIFNISQPSAILLTATIVLDAAGVTDLKIRGNELFASTYRGLYVYDVGSPATPVLIRSFATLSQVQSIGFGDLPSQSSYVYLTTLNGGIVILREQDIQSPNIYITDPVFGPAWTTTSSTTELGGGSDDSIGVAAITWKNDRGGSGSISAPFDSWYVTGIKLYPGMNNITTTAYDAAGNSGSDTIAIFYQTALQNQTITFPAIADHTFGDPVITLQAAASSGLPVTFSVVSGPATLANSNVLTLTGAGTVTMRASQLGNGLYNPASSVDATFAVEKANQAITFAPIPTKAAGDAPFALTATTSSGLPVYFNVLSGPATLSSNNCLTLLEGGSVNVLAWQPGNANYNAASTVEQSFNVSLIPQSIAFSAMSVQRAGDAPFPIAATASSGLPVSFSVLSGPASMVGNILTITGSGTVTVRASQSGSSAYAAASNVVRSLTVLPPINTTDGAKYTSGGFELSFYGILGRNYVFQASTDLVNWTNLETFTCTNAVMDFHDQSATGLAQRFYRFQSQ